MAAADPRDARLAALLALAKAQAATIEQQAAELNQQAATIGLVHGFGFASALAEGGFSGQSAVILLFAFNVGVELGQLVVIGAGFALLMLLRDKLRPSLTVDIICGAVLSLGCYWMALRL